MPEKIPGVMRAADPAESLQDNSAASAPVRPLLYLDVDGPLNPYAAKPTRRPDGYTTHRLIPAGWNPRKPLRVWLKPDHGPALLALAEHFDLVWATTWLDQANTLIAPLIGLPGNLPVLDIGTSPNNASGLIRHDNTLLFFKTTKVVAHAAGRPFAFVDDGLSDLDRDWITQNHPAPALALTINPATGLTDVDFATLSDFAAQQW